MPDDEKKVTGAAEAARSEARKIRSGAVYAAAAIVLALFLFETWLAFSFYFRNQESSVDDRFEFGSTLVPVFLAREKATGAFYLVNEKDLGVRAYDPQGNCSSWKRNADFTISVDRGGTVETLHYSADLAPADILRQRRDPARNVEIRQKKSFGAPLGGFETDLDAFDRPPDASGDGIKVAATHEVRFLKVAGGAKAALIEIEHYSMGTVWRDAVVYNFRGAVPAVLARITRYDRDGLETADGASGEVALIRVTARNVWRCYSWDGECFRLSKARSADMAFMLFKKQFSYFFIAGTPVVFFTMVVCLMLAAGRPGCDRALALIFGALKAAAIVCAVALLVYDRMHGGRFVLGAFVQLGYVIIPVAVALFWALGSRSNRGGNIFFEFAAAAAYVVLLAALLSALVMGTLMSMSGSIDLAGLPICFVIIIISLKILSDIQVIVASRRR